MINSLIELEAVSGKRIKHRKIIEEGYGPYDENVLITHHRDEITFKMLTKPASEGGDLNRCQWSDLVSTGLEMLKYLNNKFPCRENALTITKLEEALMWNDARTKNRLSRNVEGKNEK